ncbi:hypothetical protein ACTA71_002327 [Dictyostelium dimigraforme]
MLKITKGLLATSKTKNPKSVFTKSLSNFFENGELVKKKNENDIENQSKNEKEILNEQSNPNEDGILFKGNKVYRKNEDYEFSKSNYPTKTTSYFDREIEKKIQYKISRKEAKARDEMIKLSIEKEPKKKVLIEKFYNDFREKQLEKKINVEISQRDQEFIYDEISLDPPENPRKQLDYLLNSIKNDTSMMLKDLEQPIYQNLVNHENLLSNESKIEIEAQVKDAFRSAKILNIAGDRERSFRAFKELSDSFNHGMSHILIANMYFTGIHPQDIKQGDDDDDKPNYELAFRYFYKAATTSKIPVAFGMMGELLYKNLVDIDFENYFPGSNKIHQRERSLSMAKICFAIASQLGLKSSTEQLAFLYLGELKNDNGAIKLLKRLALFHNDINAITTMGALLLEDHPSKARDLWLYASKMGDANAQTNLGRYYYSHSQNPDYNNAFTLWSAAAKLNHPDALFYLGGMFHSGLVVEKNVEKSLQLYEISAKGGNSNSQFLIGRAYIEGDGIGKNLELGYKYLSNSLAQDNETAKSYFEELDEIEKEQYLNYLNKNF